jgi:hypothetical protein
MPVAHTCAGVNFPGVDAEWADEIEILRRRRVPLDRGLTPAETSAVQDFLGVQLPPDLISFLEAVLPIGPGFPNWRNLNTQELHDKITTPFHGIAFDIEHNDFWWPAWGTRPVDLRDAVAIAHERLANEPPLVPLFIHRYLPAEPLSPGNPVISVHQTDIIYYGLDLRRYIAHEFGGLRYEDAVAGSMRRIRFWSDIIDAWL